MDSLYASVRRTVFTAAILASFFALQIFYALSAQECFSSNILGTALGSGAIMVVSEISNNAENSALHSDGSRVLSFLRLFQANVHKQISADDDVCPFEYFYSAYSLHDSSPDALCNTLQFLNVTLLI